MKTDRFYTVEIVNRISRTLMLFFEGLVLGSILSLGCYYVFKPPIELLITLIVIYCIIFGIYVAVTNSLRKVTKIEIFKDKLSFVFEKSNQISQRKDADFNDIKSYKISPLTYKKNLLSNNPDKEKFSLRAFGFMTNVELNNGEIITFRDSYSDGVLIYSPAYVYRMIDLKRFVPDFPLILENFESKKEPENFNFQFKYYEELNKNTPLIKNKRYLLHLIKYTIIFTVIAAAAALIISYTIYSGLNDKINALIFLYAVFAILACIVIPMWLIAFFTSYFGNIFNLKAKNIIEKIVKE